MCVCSPSPLHPFPIDPIDASIIISLTPHPLSCPSLALSLTLTPSPPRPPAPSPHPCTTLYHSLHVGGWANRWYNDVYSLSVKSIVGPPYAVLDVSPKVSLVNNLLTPIINLCIKLY